MRELFEFEKTDCSHSEDSQYNFKSNPNLYIQVCDTPEYEGFTFYSVNKLVWIDNICNSESFGEYESLDDAMKKVLDLHKEKSGA